MISLLTTVLTFSCHSITHSLRYLRATPSGSVNPAKNLGDEFNHSWGRGDSGMVLSTAVHITAGSFEISEMNFNSLLQEEAGENVL